MRKLYYMGLESYKARYTLQLTEWNKRVFDARGLDVVYVPGLTLDNSQQIVVGQVLDAHGRSYFGMSQMMNLVQLMQQGEVTAEDVIYFEDMFQPGFESLGYNDHALHHVESHAPARDLGHLIFRGKAGRSCQAVVFTPQSTVPGL